MANQYFKPVCTYKLTELVDFSNAKVVGELDLSTDIDDIVGLGQARPGTLSFLTNPSYAKFLPETKATAVLVDEKTAAKIAASAHSSVPLLVVKNAYIEFARILALFYPINTEWEEYIDPSAFIHPDAEIGEGVYISPGVYIGANVTLEAKVFVGPHSVLACAQIGEGTKIASSVSIKYAIIGKNCLFHDGVRIGQDGFGFAPNYAGEHVKIPQVGLVEVGDNVELGANTCVDRGALSNTVIQSGTKIDNLVQIGHNVKIGKNCFIGGQTGVAGSTVIEDNVAMGGQTGISPHITIGTGAQIAPKSGVLKSVVPGQTILGSPAREMSTALRIEALLNKLVKKTKKYD